MIRKIKITIYSCFIIFVLNFFVSCKNNDGKIAYFDKIENEEELQSVVLFSVKNDSIATVQYNILHGFYNEQKKQFNYSNFKNLLENLNKLSNKEKRLLNFTKNYKFDIKIRKLENLSFDEKVKKLSLENNSINDYYISPSKYSKEELYSILYIFYHGQNYVLYNDDLGQYIILEFNKVK